MMTDVMYALIPLFLLLGAVSMICGGLAWELRKEREAKQRLADQNTFQAAQVQRLQNELDEDVERMHTAVLSLRALTGDLKCSMETANKLRAMVAELREAMRTWACDCDGIHYLAADAYNRASSLLGMPGLLEENEHGEQYPAPDEDALQAREQLPTEVYAR